jgi:hypothetical protein
MHQNILQQEHSGFLCSVQYPRYFIDRSGLDGGFIFLGGLNIHLQRTLTSQLQRLTTLLWSVAKNEDLTTVYAFVGLVVGLTISIAGNTHLGE